MIQLGLIGAGIAKSSSPRLHEFLGRTYGLPITYRKIDADEIPEFDFSRTLLRCGEKGYRGVNVTHPYKELARNKAEVSNPEEAQIGAINTIVFEQDGLQGSNTDFSGFVEAFRRRFATALPGVPLIVGTGGVGKAIAFSLSLLGADEIWLFDIDVGRAEKLALALRQAGITAVVVAKSDLRTAMKNANGLVNGTPIGMYQHPGTPFPVDAVGGQDWAFDAVYTPLETEFIIHARANNLEVVSGYDLFLFQGIHAFKLFTGLEVDVSEVMNTFPP